MVDIPGSAATSTTVTVGSSTVNTLEVVGDRDWFRVNLVDGQAITVLLSGVTLQDPYLRIRDSSGTVIWENDDIHLGVELDSQLSFEATYTGVYFIDVGSWNDQGSGDYQLNVTAYQTPPVFTNDQIAEQLVSGYWGDGEHPFNVASGGSLTVNLTALNAAGLALARAALQNWSQITGINFIETSGAAQITFDDNEQGAFTESETNPQTGLTTSAHVNVHASWLQTYGSAIGGYAYQAYLHEIGHALGLGHAGNYNNTANYPYDTVYLNDAWSTSIMSYFDQDESTYFDNQNFTNLFLVTPMVADILAMQQLYGLSTTTRSGDTTYGFNTNAGTLYDASAATNYRNFALTIFDTGGNDTLDFSEYNFNQTINLNPETFSNIAGRIGNMSIARGSIIENAIGGTMRDTIIGNSVANILTGGQGQDNLTGGGGNDTFRDSALGLNSDTIADFAAGDRIVITDATLAGFTYNLSGNTLTFTGGSLTLTAPVTGNLVASAAPGGGVQLIIQTTVDARNDFNGDGYSDFLLRNVGNGWLTEFLGSANGSFTNNSGLAGQFFGLEWQVTGTGDFNGDGRDDFLLRNVNNGWLTEFLGSANGAFTNNSGVAGQFFGLDWQVAGTGDFNGDGRDDFLLRNSNNGWLTEFLGNANGSFTNNGATAAQQFGLEWQVAGTGDFNGDGRDDFLLRNTNSGWMTEFLGNANGSFTNNAANAAIHFGLEWEVSGTGDFNGDGRDDFLLRNTNNGWLTEYLGNANGSFTSNSGVAGQFFGLEWQIAGIGDYNGDGRDDFLLRNVNNGWLTEFLGSANGAFTNNSANAGQFFGLDWQVQAPDLYFV